MKILVIQNLIGSFKLIKFTLEMDLNKIFSINFNIEGLILNLDFMKIIEDGFFNTLINENKCFKLDEKIKMKFLLFLLC